VSPPREEATSSLEASASSSHEDATSSLEASATPSHEEATPGLEATASSSHEEATSSPASASPSHEEATSSPASASPSHEEATSSPASATPSHEAATSSPASASPSHEEATEATVAEAAASLAALGAASSAAGLSPTVEATPSAQAAPSEEVAATTEPSSPAGTSPAATTAEPSAALDSNSDDEPTQLLDTATLRARKVEGSSPEAQASSSDADGELGTEAAPPSEELKTLPLAVEQALVLEHALDGEPAPDPAPPAKPERDFSSIGSETPVVLSASSPHPAEGPAAAFLEAGRAWLPEAKAWSKKTLRATPRTLVIGAPFVALFGIWAAHSLAKHSHADSPTVSAVADVAPANAEGPARAAAPASPAAPEPVVLAPPPLTAAVAVAEPARPAASADPAELKSAKAHGLPALETLAAKYPGDLQVVVALASQQAHAQRFEAAVKTVDQLLGSSPDSAQNGKVMGILWRAAQSPASEQTFASLRKLGARGSDVEFDLAATPGVRESVRERARTELAEHLAPDASSDTRVASALLLAPDCNSRKSLVERAGAEGGKRTRALLERYSQGAGCASGDSACSACLAGNPALTQALAKISERAKP
jgi:hypothetical protein